MCFVDTWEAAQARRIGSSVKALRGSRTGQWLSDRTADIGLKMTRQTLTDLENGRRRYVTTAELAVLAAALNVPPIVLLYPGPDYGEYIEVLPGVHDQQVSAAQWFSGIRDHGYSAASGAGQASARAQYRDSVRTLQLWRELTSVEDKISSVAVPARRVDGQMVVGDLTDVQKAQLEMWHNQAFFLRSQLGLDEAGNGG